MRPGLMPSQRKHHDIPSGSNPRKTNISWIVMQFMIKDGLNIAGLMIQALGAAGSATSNEKSNLGVMQTLMAWLEQNAGKNGIPKWNGTGLSNLKAFAKKFVNEFMSNPKNKTLSQFQFAVWSSKKHEFVEKKISVSTLQKYLKQMGLGPITPGKPMSDAQKSALENLQYAMLKHHYVIPKGGATVKGLNKLYNPSNGTTSALKHIYDAVVGDGIPPWIIKDAAKGMQVGITMLKECFSSWAQTYYEKQNNPASDPGKVDHLSNMQGALTSGISMLGTQTQEYTTDVQQVSAEESSDDGIAKQIIQLTSQMIEAMIRGQRPG